MLASITAHQRTSVLLFLYSHPSPPTHTPPSCPPAVQRQRVGVYCTHTRARAIRGQHKMRTKKTMKIHAVTYIHTHVYTRKKMRRCPPAYQLARVGEKRRSNTGNDDPPPPFCDVRAGALMILTTPHFSGGMRGVKGGEGKKRGKNGRKKEEKKGRIRASMVAKHHSSPLLSFLHTSHLPPPTSYSVYV
mmetsp:Transcript_11996/g.32503  ORF Transcript_11996/g.32503 Transcript_11996/m.32503 type:complete len:189 (-) Transcript_11996:137-703(-)